MVFQNWVTFFIVATFLIGAFRTLLDSYCCVMSQTLIGERDTSISIAGARGNIVFFIVATVVTERENHH